MVLTRSRRSLVKPRVDDVLVALRGAFSGKGWHGPSVLDAIKGVTAKKAKKRRGKASNSKQQTVDFTSSLMDKPGGRWLVGRKRALQRWRGDRWCLLRHPP